MTAVHEKHRRPHGTMRNRQKGDQSNSKIYRNKFEHFHSAYWQLRASGQNLLIQRGGGLGRLGTHRHTHTHTHRHRRTSTHAHTHTRF